MHIWKMARLAHDNAKDKGFWDRDMVSRPGEAPGVLSLSGPRFSECLMLIVSEAAEALEEYRRHGLLREELDRTDGAGKPEGIASELADIMIRVGDLSQALGIDIDQAVADKMKFNATRPRLHGGKHA
jgi:NTP pyrophosphatase (non-canonical NTP hydrolase)